MNLEESNFTSLIEPLPKESHSEPLTALPEHDFDAGQNGKRCTTKNRSGSELYVYQSCYIPQIRNSDISIQPDACCATHMAYQVGPTSLVPLRPNANKIDCLPVLSIQYDKCCTLEGCPNPARCQGLCPMHGGRTLCTIDGCTKDAASDGKCVAHGGGRRCRYGDCTNSAVSRGLCILHGGGRKCRYEGCHKHIASGGLCRAHGGGRRCKMDGCNSSAQSRGLCYVHGGGGRCQQLHCTSSAKKGGFCIAHGGGHRCSVRNCKSSAVSGDLCRAHGGGRRCNIIGCKSSAKTGGFCIAHGGGKRCSVEGCKSSAQRIGLCKAHGGGRKCNEANCHNSAVSRGKCIAHGGGKRCATEGCNTTARKGGFCFAHGNRFKEYGELESPHSTPIEALTEETMFPRPRLPSISEILRLDRKLCGSVWHEKLPPLRRNSDVETFNGSKPVSNVWESQRATVAERMENVCGYSYNGGRGVENRQLDMEGQARSSLRMLISAVLCN